MQDKGIGQVCQESGTESGLPVVKNFTPGISPTNLPRTERIADEGSPPLHSSRASMAMAVEIPVLRSGSTGRRDGVRESRRALIEIAQISALVRTRKLFVYTPHHVKV